MIMIVGGSISGGVWGLRGRNLEERGEKRFDHREKHSFHRTILRHGKNEIGDLN